MKQQVDFRIVKIADKKTQFIFDNIIITIGKFSYDIGEHKIADPKTAYAHFVFSGKLYSINNSAEIATVEEWYREELLPKFQMICLLEADIPIENSMNDELPGIMLLARGINNCP